MADKQERVTQRVSTPIQDPVSFDHFADGDWCIECERRLEQLRSLQENWDTYGAAPPNDTSITRAKIVVHELASVGLRRFQIEPSVEEGVCISFRRGDVYADIEAFNSGEVVAAFSDGREEPEVWEVEPTEDGVRQATRLIRDRLENCAF